MIRADLHVHTRFSRDSSIRPKTVVEQLYAHPYIKAAAVTDHNTLEGCQKARKLAEDYGDILVIPGVEMNLLEGELILLGVEDLPPKPWTLKNAIAYAKKENAVTVAPHPFRGYGLRDAARNPEIDAIEVLNGGFQLRRISWRRSWRKKWAAPLWVGVMRMRRTNCGVLILKFSHLWR